MAAVKFRFQDLKIWQLAIEIANELFDLADKLDEKRTLSFRRTTPRGSNVNV